MTRTFAAYPKQTPVLIGCRGDKRMDQCPANCSEGGARNDGAACPVRKNAENHFNPKNNMPYAEVLEQSVGGAAALLSAERTASSIPRADAEEPGCWTYPSSRMFYNALERKGKAVPAEHIESMLAVHNELNEAVWREVVKMERRLAPGCETKLRRFMGRPSELSPRAWWHVNVRWGEGPFDRHDWVVDRCGREVRYVIDYYSAGASAGQATFSVDIRPALDSPRSLLDRFWLFWDSKVQDNPAMNNSSGQQTA